MEEEIIDRYSDKKLINKVILIAKENKENFNTSLLQSKLLKSGFNVGNFGCNRLVDELEELGIVEICDNKIKVLDSDK